MGKSESKNDFILPNVSNGCDSGWRIEENSMREINSSETAKRKIADALESCLQTKRLEKVTVAEIMRKANMTRQMFYHYFQDIHDLVYWMHHRHIVHHTARFFEEKKHIFYTQCYLDPQQGN